MERQHQLAGESLLQGMLADERLELRDRLARQPPQQIGVDASLDRLQPQPVETGDLILCEGLVGEVLVGPTPPRGERLTELSEVAAGSVSRSERPSAIGRSNRTASISFGSTSSR